MAYFTPEEITPSESTINLIKQIAHTYRTVRLGDTIVACCLS